MDTKYKTHVSSIIKKNHVRSMSCIFFFLMRNLSLQSLLRVRLKLLVRFIYNLFLTVF